MPTYEYECPEGHTFDLFQRMSDEPVAECPECGATSRRKISGGAGFLFKGDGFYITDYRSEEYKKKASAEGKASTDAGSASAASEGKGSSEKAVDKASSKAPGKKASPGSSGSSGSAPAGDG